LTISKWCLSDYPYSEQQYWPALDLSILTCKSDLSITLADGSSVNLSVLPQPKTGTVQAQVDDVLAVVQSVSSGQVKIKTAAGELLVSHHGFNTTYNYPQSVCQTSGLRASWPISDHC